MVSSYVRLGSLFLAGAVLCAFAPGCDSSGGLEKPTVQADTKPDMSKMPGFNEMQDKMKTKKGATSK